MRIPDALHDTYTQLLGLEGDYRLAFFWPGIISLYLVTTWWHPTSHDLIIILTLSPVH